MNDATVRKIIEDSYRKETTRSNYLARLNNLQQACNNTPLFQIISSPDAFYDALRKTYPNISTRKNILTLILALFKNSQRLRDELQVQHKRWRKFHDDMDGFQEAKYSKNMPDPDQLAKYTPMEDIDLKYKELKKVNPHDTLQSSQQFVLLSIITTTPPKRSDYGNMHIYYERDPNLKEANYMVLRDDPKHTSYMVFTKFKTAGEYARVDQDLPRQAAKDIKDSLRRHPRTHLFVNRFGDPFNTNNAFTKYVIRTFNKLFKRNTGVTMLRHIYITEKVSWDEMNDEDLGEIAHQMMHSTKLQRKYNWNKKAICDNLKRICDECK